MPIKDRFLIIIIIMIIIFKSDQPFLGLWENLVA